MRRSLRWALPLAACLACAACHSRLMRYPESEKPADCPRGQPKPLLSRDNKQLFGPLFRETGQGRAMELARLEGGIGLIIRHSGCDAVAHEFVFELRGRPAPVEDRGWWYARTARLLELIAAGSPDEAGLRIMAKRLDDASAEAPPYDTPLPLDDFQSLSLRAAKEERPERTLGTFRYAFKL